MHLAEARSKFEVDLGSDSDSSVCEEDLLKIALQKSMDPTEQIDLDNRVKLNFTKLQSNRIFHVLKRYRSLIT